GGGGGGELIFWLLYLCWQYPVVGVPLLIAVVALMIFASKQGNNAYRGRVIRRGAMALNSVQREAAVARLQEADPAFDEQQFYARVSAAMLKIQSAWSEQKIEAVRAFISDGIYERFSLQIQEQRDLGYRNRMENVVVHQTLLAQVESDEPFDVVTVRIQASALDYRERLDNGNRIGGTTRTDKFTEFWTFLRRRGVKTDADRPGLMEGNCPNCGTDVTLNRSAKCTSCDSLLRSGQYDWVLCEITQECEWRASEQREIPGIADYRQNRDPGFNVQHLEDRASVIFWRKAMADRLGDTAALAKMATSEFCDGYAEHLKPGPKGRLYFGDCAVGSVEMRGLLPGSPMDRVVIEIRWSGKRFAASDDGPPRPISDNGSLFRQFFVLGRRSGVKTDAGLAVSSSHCPGCGAPEEDLTSHACEFCGEVLGDGSHDWVLLEIHPTQNEHGKALLQELRGQAPVVAVESAASSPGGTELLAWAIKLALADNTLDVKERAMLDRVARRRGVPSQQLETLIAAAQRGQMDVPEPANREQAQQWLEAMADVALADGRVDRAEAALLMQAGERIDWTVHDLRALLNRRKKALYQAARQQLSQR
ncbi:MAG: TIM44-like domain-containing protein, partial [Candidatus Nealsonbacteria bacterium]|nr:TIM44-like domain-containing protein [Candidatus Nealsonbacteria bacterium]